MQTLRNLGLFLPQEGDVTIWGLWQWQHEENESTESTELPLKRERGTWDRGERGAEGTGCWNAASDTITALLGRNCDLQSLLEFPSPKDPMIEGFLFLFMSDNIVYAISTCFISLDVCWMVQASKNSSTNHHPWDPWRLAHHKAPQTEAMGFHWRENNYFLCFLPTLIPFRQKTLAKALAGLLH